jgi:hypothetical protein
VFSFRCPVEVLAREDEVDTNNFEVPKDTWGVAFDDSKVQRKLLARILKLAGVEESRIKVIGEDHSDVEALEELLLQLVTEHPEDKILVLVDENLDYRGGNGDLVVMCGSLITEAILKKMTPSQESRVLALVRSANDSAEDVEIYTSRTHGFFPKAPVKCERVQEVLAHLWADRFAGATHERYPAYLQSVDTEKSLGLIDSLSKSGLKDGSISDPDWNHIKAALHFFKKGDLTLLDKPEELEQLVKSIESVGSEIVGKRPSKRTLSA